MDPCGGSRATHFAGGNDVKLYKTRIPRVRGFLPPHQSFDPETASDADLQQNGFPPKPDRKLDPISYANWLQRSSYETIMADLEYTGLRHGPVKDVKIVKRIGHRNIIAFSDIWSGFVIRDEVNNPFVGPGGGFVGAEWSVSRPVIYTNTKLYGEHSYCSSWVGLDWMDFRLVRLVRKTSFRPGCRFIMRYTSRL